MTGLTRISALAVSLAFTACSSSSSAPDPTTIEYQARIRRTSFGVPHIEAPDLAGVAFGQAFAYAADHVCELADQIVKVRSERARFHGPGDEDANIDSDFGYLSFELMTHAARALEAQSEDARHLIEGYTAGYNSYLETGPLPEACADAAWVRDIDSRDLMAHILDVAMVGVPRALITYVGRAQPPLVSDEQASTPTVLPFPAAAAASNGWAIGRERSELGSGMLVANPHFPWEGDLQLYEAQLSVPGKLNVYGASLGGVPGILIGFNEHIAWTHTVSAATQTMVYKLQLEPGAPTSYVYADELRSMQARDHTVSVLQRNGKQKQVERTLYSSHYGPMVDAPLIGWDSEHAVTMKTTALSDYAAVEHYLRQATAQTIAEFRRAQSETRGTQWANTVYADDQGHAFYFDAARVPLMDDAAAAAYDAFLANDPYAAIYAQAKVLLADGSDPIFEWRTDGVGPDHDVSPFELAPQLESDDFVFNANESYWLSQPARPLEARESEDAAEPEAFSFLYGPTRTPRSPRTRMNARLLSDTSTDGPAGADGRFGFEELKAAILSNRSLLAEELREELLQRCTEAMHVEIGGVQVDLEPACTALADWNGRYDADSGAGAVLFREFLGQFSETDLREAGALFATPFDPEDPLGTPRGLVPAEPGGPDPIVQALGKSVQVVASLGPDLQPLADVQHTWRLQDIVPVHGCLEQEGCTNVVRFSDQFNSSALPANTRSKLLSSATGLTQDGYWVNHGTSFMLVVDFGTKPPRAEALLAYGESSDPRSPHFRDQLELFWQKQLRPVAFSDAEIQADPELTVACVSRSTERKIGTSCP